ncbi:MAG: hypothetical protein JSW72_09780 [Candidatus Bathyarchaeota archaeon]|nr:MAG: hypothetical protein JSW72_09780 [Candidatus Bathyarchaeota archaeon]
MKLQLNPKFLLLINVIGAALAIGIVALLFQVDEVVNVLLYNFGLQFNYEWATPYWTFLRLALGFLGCIAGLNILSIIYLVFAHQTPSVSDRSIRLPRKVEPKIQHKNIEKEEARSIDKDENGVEVAALPMVCNKCGKVFTQPLCMFDFKSGKPRLVNVCPYCNAVLAVSGNSKIE